VHTLSIDEASVSVFEDDDGRRTAVVPVLAKGAAAMRLHFEEFHASPGVRVFLYAQDGGKIRMAAVYEGAGPLGLGDFWSDAVPGDRAVIEVEMPRDAASLPFALREVEALARFEGPAIVAASRESLMIVEGDIVLGPEHKAPGRDGVGVTRQTWPGGVVPYTLDPLLRYPQRVRDAIAHWNEQLSGHIRLQPRVSETAYVEFQQSDPTTCSSYVGKTGGAAQPVSVGDYCGTGNIIHEVGHVLGLHHEHTRRDRDTYVRLVRENIDPYTMNNFDVAADGSLLGAYDYASIMHYGAYAFSSTGLPTIVTIPAGITIGQRVALSAGDIEAVRQLYPAASNPPSTTTPTSSQTVRVTIASSPTGRTMLVDGANVVTPVVRDWIPGSAHTVSAVENMVSNGRYVFAKWSDGGVAEHVFHTPATASMLTATYAMMYRVSATSSSSSKGSVSITPASVDGTHAQNSTIMLTATPAEGSCFSGWTGALAISDPAMRLTVNRAYRITGAFQTGSVTAPAFVEASGEAQTLNVSIAATTGCIWKASTTESWLSIQNPTGKSSAVLKVKVLESAVPRSGIITVNGENILVVQRGRI